MALYTYEPYAYVPPPGLSGPEERHKVAIVGAGPVGLAMAIDLATRGVPSVVLDDNNVVSIGSRAICWAKRTLEIFDRLGVGERMLDKGVTWQVGRVFHGLDEVYSFDLLPEEGHKYPAFINLQQYDVEQYLIDRARAFPELIDLRFKNRVENHVDHGTHVTLAVDTPGGVYALEAEYMLACDGANSATRRRMELPFRGQSFDEHFLIVDVEMADSPFDTDQSERWFWFKPPFHPGQSALLHKQPDNIYRIDLQLGPDTDPNEEATEEKVMPRIKAIVGDKPFTLDWMSVYRFRCARMHRFRHSRVLFVGDSAHVVSPFGARGGNGGIQDVDNLAWKLALVLTGAAPDGLLDSYDQERGIAADENIMHSTRATDFMTPKSPVQTRFRDAVLDLARDHLFARRMINSGRLSAPCSLEGLSLQTASESVLVPPGSAMLDAPIRIGGCDTWMIEHLQGRFVLVGFGAMDLPDVEGVDVVLIGEAEDPTGLAWQRYGMDTAYLFRPDGHVAAGFHGSPSGAEVQAALARAAPGVTMPEKTI